MKFSVLLPTRNGGKYLKSCIESVLSQDYKDMELIVFDNVIPTTLLKWLIHTLMTKD